jgi:hypothetical protein
MKNHIISLFNLENRIKTISFFILFVVFTVLSQIIGTTDNLPGLAALLLGMILLCFSIFHPWNNPANYAKLAGISLGIIALIFALIYLLMILKHTEYISEAVVMITVFLFCLPAILTGLIGTVYFAIKKK